MEGAVCVDAVWETFGLGCDKVGKVELREDGAVEVADGDDSDALVVGEIDEEGLFGAEDKFYGVEAHAGGECSGSRLAR